MALSIADQIALDDALVAPADRLKIGKCNLRLSSDITSKEATLQVVYDVLKLTPFYKAFQVTADAPEIYMQEFWASAYVHNRSVRFKMNNKKHIISLEQFRDILQICPKVGNKKFVDPPLEKEIIIFLASLGHTGDIRKLSDVNVNKLHQPWRSFAAVINKCLCGTPSYDSLRLSQAQILWGMYNRKNVDYAYLLWEDFIFKIETKSSKKGSAMYYPRFTKLVVNYVMEKDPSIPRRNKDIRNSESYKEYYAMASGTIPPKTKGSKKKANTYAIPKQKPPTAPKEKKSRKGKQKTAELETISEADLTEAEQIKIITKRSRQESHISHASGSGADEGTGVAPGVPDAPDYDSEDQDDDEQAEDDEDAGKNDINEKVQDADEHNVGMQADDEMILKALEDNFSELGQTNQYAEALSSIPSTVDQYLANKMQEAVDVAVQLKYERIREESTTANQQFLDSIDDGMKKIIKEHVKKEVSKIIPKVKKLVIDQLESEVLVRSSKEANTSHAVAANLSELELKRILIDKMETNNSINRWASDDEEPHLEQTGVQKKKSGRTASSTVLQVQRQPRQQEKTTSTDLKDSPKICLAESAPCRGSMHSTMSFKGPANQEFKTGNQLGDVQSKRNGSLPVTKVEIVEWQIISILNGYSNEGMMMFLNTSSKKALP
ncbi:hypothetical protein Tco_0733360 [Tanacetum coccineum]